MGKKESINTISSLYPSDSQFPDTNEIGKQFMLESMVEVGFDWRNLPDDVLERWAEKCISREMQFDRQIRDKYK